ncbi:MAG: M20/M25/M40 family metallo-hydrolase [Myxococcota bacterium]
MRTLAPLVLLAACAPASTPRAPAPHATAHFDPKNLLAQTRRWMAVPRTLGHPERDRGIDALAQALADHGARVDRQPFDGIDPLTGAAYPLTNVFGSIRPEAPRQFVLATHYDIRPWAEEDADPAARDHPIPGANDGTSGVVVLLALLPALRDALPADVGFTVVFFDGEELGRPSEGGYCAGSRYFAAHVDDAPAPLRAAGFGIVLDMVGDADLRILREPNAEAQHPAMVDHVWQTAAARGVSAFVDAPSPVAIIDDHVYLSRAGIPSILLIDYEYPAWHTRADDIDRVSGESLATVADVVFAAVVTAPQ